MLVASLIDHVLDIERTPLTRVQHTAANLDFRTQARESVDALKQFSPDLLLPGVGQRRDLTQGQFQRFHHILLYHNERQSQSPHRS